MSESKILSANDIVQSDDLKREEVFVEAWGGSVVLQQMSGAALDAYENSLFLKVEKADGRVEYKRDHENGRAKLIAQCLISPTTGQRLFKGDDQIRLLGNKNGDALNLLHAKCRKLNGIGGEEESETEGKSDADQPSDSSTDTE